MALKLEWREASFKEAIAKYLEVQSKSKALGNYELAAEMAKNAGDVYFLLGDYRSALEQYREAQSLWRLARNGAGEMRALNLVGYVQVYSGQSETGLELALKSLNYYQRSPSKDVRFEAEAENCVGEANASLSRLHKAIEHFQRALDLWTAADDKIGQALAKLNLAYSHTDLGELEKAQNLFTESLTLYKREGDKRGEARAITGLGSIDSFLGKKQAALDKHMKAIDLLRTIGDHAGEAIAFNSIGKAYEDLGRLPIALDNYKEALRLYQQLGNVEYESVTLFYIGGVYGLKGETQTALNFFDEAVTKSKQARQPRVTAYALSAISAIQSESGQRAEALNRMQYVLRLYRQIDDRRGQATALSEVGKIYRALNQNTKALAYYKRALDLFRAAGDKHEEAAALYNMAVVEGASGNLTDALKLLKDSTEVIEILRSQIVSPDLRASYYASVRKHAELYIDLLMRLGKLHGDKSALETAFEISEHAHGRALLEVLGEASAQIRQGVNPALLEQERVLQQKLYGQAAYQMRLLAGNPEPHELEIVAREIRELTTSYRELQTQIKQQSPRYTNLVQPQPLNLEQIQAELTENSLLLEYMLGSERSYLWAVTKDSLTVYQLPARDEIERLAKSVCAALVVRQTLNESEANAYNDAVAQADAQYWRQAGQLSQILLGPVAGELEGKTILVVADGALHYLPFEALPDPVKAGGESSSEPVPLIVGHEIVSLASASILATIRQAPRTGSNEEKLIAILADPVFSATDSRMNNLNRTPLPQNSKFAASLSRLPATRVEAESIMAIIPSGTGMMATGFDADRTVVLSSDLGQYKVIHFATHGIVDIENPEMSGIMLSLVNREGESRQGLVQLHDIYNMNLANTQLVVLSACQTALGKEVRGEGLVGLSRGFIYAGASSVIASLWKVDDRATTQLMTEFYKGLFEEGLTASAALRKAKVKMWQQSRYREPFYWAAFVLQGEYQEKITPPVRRQFVTRNALPVVFIIITFGFLIVLLIRRRAQLTRAALPLKR
ncbi:MAG TPA: CHAT domain-containing tetratricopeptide repeat protein [Pyrinomonadaceae bacterium]|nr:CHAT domain-containing tetratricopeptide repeat protein [Pyrinomonadaceae bacterium]